MSSHTHTGTTLCLDYRIYFAITTSRKNQEEAALIGEQFDWTDGGGVEEALKGAGDRRVWASEEPIRDRCVSGSC